MSSNIFPPRPECTVIFYRWDMALSKQPARSQFVFTKESAARANEIACAIFGMTNIADKALINTAFVSDPKLSWFAFRSKKGSNILLGIQLLGDKSIFLDRAAEDPKIEDSAERIRAFWRSIKTSTLIPSKF